MSEYYFDEDHGIAYKIDPIVASVIHDSGRQEKKAILVHTDVKVTNVRKEKVRRTLLEYYPPDKFDLESAKELFGSTTLHKLVQGSRKISEQEYAHIKARFEL